MRFFSKSKSKRVPSDGSKKCPYCKGTFESVINGECFHCHRIVDECAYARSLQAKVLHQAMAQFRNACEQNHILPVITRIGIYGDDRELYIDEVTNIVYFGSSESRFKNAKEPLLTPYLSSDGNPVKLDIDRGLFIDTKTGEPVISSNEVKDEVSLLSKQD